jgi:hypothetical protein
MTFGFRRGNFSGLPAARAAQNAATGQMQALRVVLRADSGAEFHHRLVVFAGV